KGKITITTKGLENDKARKAGQVLNSGIITAAGDDANEAGGDVTISGDLLAMLDGTVVNASGDTEGGFIRIGGDYQGEGDLPTSQILFVGQDAILNASSRRRGNGGRVILWSDETTRFYGDIEARGGSEQGDGGFVEISS